MTQNIISGTAGKSLGGNIRDSREVGAKLLSEKVHTGELKTIDELEQDQTGNELDRYLGEDSAEMFRKFLETQALESVN